MSYDPKLYMTAELLDGTGWIVISMRLSEAPNAIVESLNHPSRASAETWITSRGLKVDNQAVYN